MLLQSSDDEGGFSLGTISLKLYILFGEGGVRLGLSN